MTVSYYDMLRHLYEMAQFQINSDIPGMHSAAYGTVRAMLSIESDLHEMGELEEGQTVYIMFPNFSNEFSSILEVGP